MIWKDTGWGTILFLAAMSRIDPGLYEAAAVDGASRTRQLWHVTLPGIKSVVALLLILRLGDVLSVGFEQILLQQSAVGPNASEVLDTYVFNDAVGAGSWGGVLTVACLVVILPFLAVISTSLADERQVADTSCGRSGRASTRTRPSSKAG